MNRVKKIKRRKNYIRGWKTYKSKQIWIQQKKKHKKKTTKSMEDAKGKILTSGRKENKRKIKC